MMRTMNLSILNSSANNMPLKSIGVKESLTTKNKMNTTATSWMGSGSQSPRGVRSIVTESIQPFTVIPNAVIPDLTEQRKEDHEERQHSL